MKTKLILIAGIILVTTVNVWATVTGEIVAWGYDATGFVSNAPTGSDFTTIAASASGSHGLALKSDGSIVGWGYNNHGQISCPAGNDFIGIATGAYHSLALKSDGSIIGWGYNYDWNNDYCGQATPPVGNNFIAIAAGGFHSIALKSDGSIIGWGNNHDNQISVPAGNNFVAIAAGVYHNLALKSDGSIVGWGNNYYGQAKPPVGNDFVSIAAGYSHGLALKDDGSIVGWGYNYNGQISCPAGNDFVAVAAGFAHSLALRSDGSIVGWGYDGYGQVSNTPSGDYFVAMACGGNTGLALTGIPELISPLADADSDQTVMDADDNGSELITLDGSGSSDSDGSIVSWVWTDELGDTIPDGEITAATLSVGIHTITLTVTDDDGLTDSDTVTITVEPFPNQPPVADADGPYTIYFGDTLTLDGSGSTDYDNDIVSYLWDLDDDNSFETDAGDQPVFDVNFAYLQSIGILVDNTYTIHLKVTDSAGQSDVADSTLIIVPKPALAVAVDIKPGSCPNPVNVKSSGVLPVAVLGTNDYDVTTIDPTSIRLSGVEPLRSGYEDVASPLWDTNDCNCTTDGPDGFLDLTLKFETQRIVEAIGDVNDGDVRVLTLTGVLFDPMPFETPIEGADCILIKGRHRFRNKADINGDGVVNSIDFAIIAENWLQSSIVEE